jgi:hypothetical protein
VTCFLLGPTQGYIRRYSDRNIQWWYIVVV